MTVTLGERIYIELLDWFDNFQNIEFNKAQHATLLDLIENGHKIIVFDKDFNNRQWVLLKTDSNSFRLEILGNQTYSK